MKREPPSTGPGPLTIVMVDRQRKHATRKNDIRRILQKTAATLGIEGELAIVFAGDALLRRLNRDFRG